MGDRTSVARRPGGVGFFARCTTLALVTATGMLAVGCVAQTEEAREQARQDLERLQQERETIDRQRQQDQIIFQ